MDYKIIDYKEGMEVVAPCIIRGMPNDVYHRMPALSNSGMKTLLNCPAKYYYKYLSGEYEPKEKPHFKIGKAAHCYLLEGRKKFEEIYWHNPYGEYKKEELINSLKTLGYDDSIKNIKVADLMEMLLESTGIEPKQIQLSSTELNQVVCMARAAMHNGKTRHALTQEGESELSLFWQDEKLGVWLKCRPDFLPYDCLNVPDYKTAESANPVNFFNSFIKYGYHIQAAMYRRGIKEVTGVDVQNFFFLVQEKEAPYVSQIYNPDTKHIVLWGDKAIECAIEKFLECSEKGVWGTYSDKIIEMKIEPAPEELGSDYDKEEGIIYAPKWIDRMLAELYEV